MSFEISREQVIAYRIAAQGLHRDASSVSALAVLDVGVQEAMGHPAALAYAARLPDGAPFAPAVGPGHRLVLAWTCRGAPHVHRRSDLDDLAGALWPLSEADATARLNETGPSVARAGISALEQFTAAVRATRAVVTAPTAKGAASSAITARIPPAMRRQCRPCGTTHVSDSAMRLASLAGGVEIEPGTSPPVLVPRSKPRAVSAVDPGALTELARRFLRLLGPAGAGEFAGYLDARRADVAAYWPDGLVDVRVDGRAGQIAEEDADALCAAPAPDIVRLLGPFDPYLQARDRALIVPDKAPHKILWPVLGRPGAVLSSSEIVGVWRTKSSGAKLTITVEPFAGLRPAVRRSIEDEAGRVASVRGASDVRVVLND